MSFGEKTGRSAFFADLGTEVVRLNEAPANYVNPIRIGRSVRINSGNEHICDIDLCVTPTGTVAAYLPATLGCNGSSPRELDILHRCSAVLRTWTHAQLDEIAGDYFYATEGQAALVIDAMVKRGLLDYSYKQALYSSIDKALASGSFLFVISDQSPAQRSRREFISDFSAGRGIDPDEMTSFICELESCDGVAAVVRGSDLIILYSAPNGVPPYPLFYFRISGRRSDLCVSSSTVRHALERSGVPLSAADDLLEFFAQFADMALTRPSPKDGSVGILYLLPDALFVKSSELIKKIKQFACAVSS